MNAPTYIEKNLGKQRDVEKQMELHNKKLQEIQDRNKKKKKQADKNMSTKIKDNKAKTHGFMKNEKNAEINRENQILLNKLVEISNGKWTSVAKATKAPKKKEVSTKRSLNYERRKKEFERIERENMAIAQRLFNKQGSISKKKMDQDYGVHKKYKKQIQKLEPKRSKRGTKTGKGFGGDMDDEAIEEDKTDRTQIIEAKKDNTTEDNMGSEAPQKTADEKDYEKPLDGSRTEEAQSNDKKDEKVNDEKVNGDNVNDEKVNGKKETDQKADDISADGKIE